MSANPLARLLLLAVVIGLCACATRAPAVAASIAATEGCPVILLVHRGGLGIEAQSGVVAAVKLRRMLLGGGRGTGHGSMRRILW